MSAPRTTFPNGGGQPSPLSVHIEKNESTHICVARSEYKGRPYIDVRTYVQNDLGDFLPTKKGVTVSPELLPSLIAALRRVEMEGGD